MRGKYGRPKASTLFCIVDVLAGDYEQVLAFLNLAPEVKPMLARSRRVARALEQLPEGEQDYLVAVAEALVLRHNTLKKNVR